MGDTIMIEYMNYKLVTELLGDIDVNFHTWVYNSDYKFYYDLILTKEKLTIIGKDIVSNHPFIKISNYGTYFGRQNEEYEENYNYHNGYDWNYGYGEINFFFNEVGGKEWFISFPRSRQNEAANFYKEFEKCYMEALYK